MPTAARGRGAPRSFRVEPAPAAAVRKFLRVFHEKEADPSFQNHVADYRSIFGENARAFDR